MATFNLTPSERRVRAQARKQQSENRRLYSQYLEAQKALEIERESAWLQEKKAESEKNNQNFFTRAFSTIGDLAANVLTGAVKGLEGIYDLGAGVVGAVGGIFDSDFQDRVKEHIAYDWTSETIGNPLQEALKYSYLKEGGIIENVASGIGQMLPAVAVSVATGGLGAPAAMAQTASLLTLGASAAGNSTEEAFSDGAGYYQGLGYGLASGAVEIATEKMFGGATKALTGAGLLDGVARSVADTGIKRIAKNALEEGVEEVVSELANPLLKSIYKGKDALADYGSADYWKGVGQAGLVGSLTALAYSGTVGYGMSKAGIGYVGKEADIADSLSEISSLKEKGTNLQNSGKLNEQMEAKIADTVKKNYQNIEKVLQKTSAEKRAKLIEKFSLDKAFTTEGKMSEQLGSWLSDTTTTEQTNTDGGEKPPTPLASPKKEYYSFGLRGSEQTIQSDLQKMTEDRRQAYAKQKGITVEEAAKKVGDIKVFDGVMSEQAQEHFTKMKKGLNILNKMSNANISFVVTEANDVFNGTIVDDRTMYIGADTFENDTWAGTLVHEYTHLAEGSEEYNKLFNHLASDDIQVDDGKGGKVKLWQKAQQSVLSQNYGFTEGQLKKIVEKANSGETLTEQETKYYDAFRSEVGARMSEYLLGNETFIDKVVAKESSFAKKFITKIQNLIKMFKRLGSESKAEFKQLKKAENLYLAAARKVGNQALVRKILKAREERGEQAAETTGEVKQEKKSTKPKKDSEGQREKKGKTRYSLKPVKPVKPSSGAWHTTIDTDKALARFPNLWNVKAEESEVRNPTQIKGTVSTYRKIYEFLKKEGFNGRILDASSGLGYGTQAGISEFGFDVEDIEPYPDSKYKPKYTDYSALDERYDVIISNAVLNVLPQDQRDALVVKMGELLNVGGRLFVNVRGDDVNNLSSNLNNVKIGEMEWYVAPTGSYQKGFTRAELVAYLKDALGSNFRVEPTTLFGKSSAIVTKIANGDIKYSLKIGDETISGTVEKTKNLVALHNLSESKLLKVLELGGFPMPSIAITKADMPYTDFGDITIIFGRDTIDPKRNSANAIYSRDAWTPTVPRAEYKLNVKKAREIYKKIHGLLDGTQVEKDFGYISIDETNLQDFLDRNDGDLTQQFERDYAIKYAYLLDSGIKLELPMVEKDFTNYAENGAIKEVAKVLPLNKINEIREGGWTSDSVKAVLEDIKTAVNEYYAKKYNIENDLYDDMDYIKACEIIKAVRKFHLGESNSRIDTQKARSLIDESVNMQDYKRWLKELFSDISEKKGIRNNVDPYTPSGYARSFEATHFDYTLENIVKVMKSRASTADSHFASPSTLAAALAKRFDSIEDLHAAEELLTEKPSDLEAVGKRYNDMLYEIASSMVGDGHTRSDTWILTDAAANVVQEAAEMGKRTADDIYSYIQRRYSKTYIITSEIASKIESLFAALSNAETNMFEAKPRRAVGFEEIKEVLLPKTVNQDVISALEKKGINYTIYDNAGDNARTDIIKSLDGIKFSLKDSEGNILSEGQREFFAGSKVRDDEGNLLVVYHGTMSGEFTVFDASYANVEGDMGAGFYFSSSYSDVNSNHEEGGQDLEAKIERLAERLEYEEEIDYDEAKEKARAQLSKSSKLFEVYLDMKNPAYVGGNYDNATYIFEDLVDFSDIDIEDYDGDEDAYWEARYERQEESLQELVNDVNRILEEKGIGGYEGWEAILFESSAFDEMTITELKELFANNLEAYDDKGNLANNEVVRAIVEALGYDGIIDNSVVDKWGYNSGRMDFMEGLETRHYIVFKPEQIKLTTNLNPTTNEDIRFSLKDDPSTKKYFAELTDGQVKKLLADNTKLKVYSKVEAEGIVNNIISNYLDFGEKYGVISGKTKKQAIEMLWRGLNTADPGKQMKVALDIAEYIIQNSVMESVYDDIDSETHTWTISLLKPYLHSIDLSHIKGEIKYRYGNDNSAYLLWGKRKGEKGMGADQIAQILEEQGMKIDALNEAEIFLEIDSAYRSAVAALKNKAKTLLSSAMSSTERKELKQQIAREVLIAFDKNGKPSKLSKIIDQYREKANVWKKAYYEERSKNKVLNRLLDKVQKLKDIKLGTFLNASQFKSDIFKGSIEKLANIKYRGNLNEAGTRKIVASLSEWYVKDNPMLEGVYEDEVADMLRSISEGEGKLTVDELKTLENIVDYFKHFVETYNKVYRNGEFIDAQPIAQNYVKLLHENKSVKVGWFAKLSGMKYFKTFADPMTVARRMDMYESGFYTEMLERLREGAVGASVMEMEMREPLEEFFKKNKKYLKELSKRTVKYQGKDIPLPQALLLYMTLNREQAIRGLAESGFTYTEEKETVRIKGFAENYEGEELTIEQMKEMAKGVQEELSKQFSELDKEYISIAEKLFNETCKQAKRETDIKRKGYSNALDDYYVPIRRAFIAHNVDTSTFADEMNRVSNASFNKDTVKGAKNELYIEALDSVLDRHIRAVAQYANLSLAIDEYNKLFNLDIGDNPNKPQSVRTESVDTWREGDSYFKKLISDIQGIPVVKGEGAKFMSFIRGGYAKFQLGANPKVWVTQLSSFAAAGSILDLGSITRGLSIKTADVDEYCPLAKLRNNDNTVALAQGVLDKVGKVGNALMIPIGKVDRFVVKRLFGACQVQVEKDNGLKIGTEENKVKAGELLKWVILETQQNAMATERSAAMRSGNELMKTLTMFTADSMKVIGRVIDAVGELSVLKAKLKATTDTKQIAELNEKIKQANKKTRKAIASLVASAVFMALVAQLFRTLYNRDDDDDNIAVNMTVDAIGNLFGGLPIIKDIYARFTEGYDLDNYAYSAINNLFDSAEGIFNMVGNIFSGEWDSKELAKNAKDLLFTAGQILGLPTRNIYNIGYGLIKRFSPSTAYKIDDMFYNQNYRSDLNKAIEKDDEDMIATIVGIMLDDNIGDITNSSVRKELNNLVKAGYNVIPRSVGNSVTYEGEEHALSSKQVKEFKAIYSTANEALASLVTLSQYASATDEVKAKAVNFVFDTYYNLALQDFLGVELESKNVLFAEAIDIEKLAIIIAMARSLTADLDKKGNVISGTRKAKVQSYINSLKLTAAQKYMIMGYLGYTNTKGEAQVKAYINRLKLTTSEKKKLLKYSGYSA